jgi:hypothetical protein
MSVSHSREAEADEDGAESCIITVCMSVADGGYTEGGGEMEGGSIKKSHDWCFGMTVVDNGLGVLGLNRKWMHWGRDASRSALHTAPQRCSMHHTVQHFTLTLKPHITGAQRYVGAPAIW